MDKFLNSNSSEMRLARTIVQGVIGVLIANMDTIVSCWKFSAGEKTLVVALVMAVLSPIMSVIGSSKGDE